MKEIEEDTIELEELREAARIGCIYHSNNLKFRRNKNLSEVMHVVLHLCQFISVLTIESFHHIHHAINRQLREKNLAVPNLPEERNPVFLGYLLCSIETFLLSMLWIFYKKIDKKIEISIGGCVVGITAMFLSAIFTMRHAEIYINIEEISDAELLRHPIFIHNFVLCVLSIFTLGLFLLHFWILYDCFKWKQRMLEPGNNLPQNESSSSVSNSENSDESHGERLQPIPNWNSPKDDSLDNIEDEPVILYCCCLDCWNYFKSGKNENKATNEFQVIHVM
ncbi:hypothetical protein HCN44_011207 [Aphidius gifuensis]|uniref:Uncharacterized protein n=1 Tax=Aphidius gifuensis TaxID=684658 RepID=A0A834XX34_APHGI|nr:hypothetical protein HCN44_011207 [Aphidius gifuensis]